MVGWMARALALTVGTAAGCLAGASIDRARRSGTALVAASPGPMALVGAVSLADTVRGTAGLDRRSPWVHLGIGFITGLVLTTLGDGLAAALDG